MPRKFSGEDEAASPSVLAACGKKGGGSANDACQAAVTKLYAADFDPKTLASLPPETQDKIKKGTSQLVEAIAQLCRDDSWSEKSLKCIAEQARPGAACDDTFTPEQRHRHETKRAEVSKNLGF